MSKPIASSIATLIELIHEGQDILVDGRSRKIDRYAGRCAAWAEKVEVALQSDPLSLSRFRGADRSTITTGVPANVMGEWQITRGRVDVLIGIAGEPTTSKREMWRFWIGLLVGIILGMGGTIAAMPSDRIDAIRTALHQAATALWSPFQR